VQIDLHRWHDDIEARRQAKAQARQQAEQARQAAQQHPAGSGSGSASDPFIFGDESKQAWRPFGQNASAPEPSPQRARGPRR
jgi:hypothetical protein